MAIYRFKVSFEDYDDVVREIDIKSNQTFEDLHHAIHRSTNYNPEVPSSFYVSNDHWIKSQEIAYLPNERKVKNGVTTMPNSKLSAFIDDPHQKFYYTYNFDRPLDFHVELIKILLNEEAGKDYPCVVKSIGEVPRVAGTGLAPSISASSSKTEDEFDFFNEEEFQPEDADHLENMDMGHEEDEEDEDMMHEDDEFSDNENYESDDYGHQNDDY